MDIRRKSPFVVGLSSILIVDDEPNNISILSQLLRPICTVRAAKSGKQALHIVSQEPVPDLILLDVMMPEMSGFDVMSHLQSNPATKEIPVIFLTALTDTQNEEHGLRLGAVDFITKPIRPEIVHARIKTQLQAKFARDILKNENFALEAEVKRRTAENDLIQQISIRALAHLAEIRDPETGAHILRTQGYVKLLALNLMNHLRFSPALTFQYIDLLARSAPLHDIGKVGIPDYILLKPGKLNSEEWRIMQTHARLGSDAISQAEADIKIPLHFLEIAKEIAHWHHEKWDGSGYPDRLVGDAIPISARLMALADVFDALISKRVYKEAIPYQEAKAIIVAGSGTHFDPEVVNVFVQEFEYFVEIAEHFKEC